MKKKNQKKNITKCFFFFKLIIITHKQWKTHETNKQPIKTKTIIIINKQNTINKLNKHKNKRIIKNEATINAVIKNKRMKTRKTKNNKHKNKLINKNKKTQRTRKEKK